MKTYRIESDSESFMFYLDGLNNRISIGKSAPSATLDVAGSAIFNNDGNDNDFRIESDTEIDMFFLDAGNDRIGIGTGAPNAVLDVRGDAIFNELSTNADFRVESDSESAMLFVDGGEDRVGIGTNTPSRDIHLVHAVGPSTHGLMIENAGANNNSWTLYVQNSTADLSLYFGNIKKGDFSDVDGTYSAVSDLRLKEKIEPIGLVLPSLLKLSAKKYFFKDDKEQIEKSVGFIAQEAIELFPEFVNETGETEADKLLSINYAGFSVVAIKAIQEQQVQIESLQKELAKVDILNKN